VNGVGFRDSSYEMANGGAGSYTLNSWHHFVLSVDHAGNGTAYVDASPVLSATLFRPPSTQVDIGYSSFATNQRFFAGQMDEMRVATRARSAAWIAAEYANQSSPNTFMTIGPASQNAASTAVVIQTNPAGLQVTVGGVNQMTPYTWNCSGGSITVTVPVQPGSSSGSQYVYGSWADGGSQARTITCPASNTSYTANFATQYYLTTTAGSGGTVSPGSGWFNAGQSVAISASSGSGYRFGSWTGAGNGSYSGSNPTSSVTMNGPISETASFVDTTPPAIMPQISGTLGDNGWYRSNVTVSWSVNDPESGIASASGCTSTSLTADTAGQTLTCMATNGAGLSSSVPVTIKIDKTPPIISGMPAPGCSVSPPNHKLVQVTTVTASDVLSGLAPGSLKVTGTSNESIDPNDPAIVITPNGSGGFVVQLQADRPSNGTGRVYTLNATAMDNAGNTATATATCTVPRGQ
jgi:hypothetical protein